MCSFSFTEELYEVGSRGTRNARSSKYGLSLKVISQIHKRIISLGKKPENQFSRTNEQTVTYMEQLMEQLRKLKEVLKAT
jgi:hypothetical protein